MRTVSGSSAGATATAFGPEMRASTSGTRNSSTRKRPLPSDALRSAPGLSRLTS